MRRIVYTALLVSALLLFVVAAGPKTGMTPTMALRTGMGNELSGLMGGVTAVDTFKLKVGSASNPNTNSGPTVHSDNEGAFSIHVDGWYDAVTEDDDGSVIRYGSISAGAGSTTPNYNQNGIVAGRGNEDDHGTAPIRMSFLAFNIGELTAGHRVESAHIFFSPRRFGSADLTTGFFAVRADTNVLDYDMLGSFLVETENDSNWVNTSWDELDIGTSQAWVPELDARDDWHDFGPRSNDIYAPLASVDENTPVRLNVTAALQQVLDRDETGGWIIFVMYAVGSPLAETPWAASDNSGRAAHGAPSISIVTTSRRGTQAWGGVLMPFNMSFDDNHDAHIGFYEEVVAAGQKFTAVSYVNGFNANASYDSLLSPNLVNAEVVHHSLSHARLGDVTGAALDAQLERSDWYSGAYWTTPPDTSAYTRHMAWPGGTGTKYSYEAIEKMVTYGYESCRATDQALGSPIGDTTYLSWDAPVNRYAIVSHVVTPVLDSGGGPVSDDKAGRIFVREELTDLVDRLYTDENRSALLVFGHGSAGQLDGMSTTSVRMIYEIADSLNCLTPMSYEQVVRLRGANFIDPALITAANGYTATQESNAAPYANPDSVGSVEKMRRVWLDRK